MTKSAENCGFGHIYQRNPDGKFFCAVQDLHLTYITSSEHVGDMYAQSGSSAQGKKLFSIRYQKRKFIASLTKFGLAVPIAIKISSGTSN